MSTAHEVLAEVKAARLRAEAEDLQGQLAEQEPKLLKQGKRSHLPKIVMVFLSVVGLGILVLSMISYLRDPAGVGLRGFALPIFSILYMGIVAIQVQTRHAKALAELIRLKAPDLHEELKNKGVL
jgi:hypothetical protein